MRGKMRANLAEWLTTGPRHQDFTSSKRDSKFPGAKRTDRPKKRDSCTQGSTSAKMANGHHHGKRPTVDSDLGRQKTA